MVNIGIGFFVILTILVIFNTVCNMVLIKDLDDVHSQIEQFGIVVKGAVSIVKSCTDVIAKAAGENKNDENKGS